MKTSIKRAWPLIASVGSGLIMLITFLIPSLQDQFDRYQGRQIIQAYVQLGDEFMDEGSFGMAEQAYAKAYLLSEEKRIDIEIKRLHAKISKIGMDPDWASEIPDDIEEVDFQMLLHWQAEANQKTPRIATLNNYAIFLASKGDPKKAEVVLKEAVALDSTDCLSLVNYGNLMDQLGKKPEAERLYRKALVFDPRNPGAHYNLGLLLLERGDSANATREFYEVLVSEPGNEDAKIEFALLSKKFPVN